MGGKNAQLVILPISKTLNRPSEFSDDFGISIKIFSTEFPIEMFFPGKNERENLVNLIFSIHGYIFYPDKIYAHMFIL